VSQRQLCSLFGKSLSCRRRKLDLHRLDLWRICCTAGHSRRTTNRISGVWAERRDAQRQTKVHRAASECDQPATAELRWQHETGDMPEQSTGQFGRRL